MNIKRIFEFVISFQHWRNCVKIKTVDNDWRWGVGGRCSLMKGFASISYWMIIGYGDGSLYGWSWGDANYRNLLLTNLNVSSILQHLPNIKPFRFEIGVTPNKNYNVILKLRKPRSMCMYLLSYENLPKLRLPIYIYIYIYSNNWMTKSN